MERGLLMPIRKFDYHEILDQTECVSCGAPNGRVIYRKGDRQYRQREDGLVWELAEETKPARFRHGKEIREQYLETTEFPHLEGWSREKVRVENGFCHHCIQQVSEWRFRGVWGWKAYMRDQYGKTYAVPHASELQAKRGTYGPPTSGVPEKPDAD